MEKGLKSGVFSSKMTESANRRATYRFSGHA